MAFPDESYEQMMSGLGGIPAQAPTPPPAAAPTTQVAPRQEPAPANRPAETRPATRAQPGGQETIEALRQLLTQFQTRAATPRSEPQSGGLLETLRQRVQTQMAEEDDRRLRDIGIGMLRSRSPNFFTALGEGFAAAEEGSRSRMDRLRQAAEAERQQRALDVEEARRQEELRIREEQQRIEAPLRTAQARQAEAMARFYEQGGSGAGRGQITPVVLSQIYQRAQTQALRDFPDPAAGMPESEATRNERLRRRAQRAEELIAGALAAAGQTPASTPAVPAPPAVPTIEVNPVGRPAR